MRVTHHPEAGTELIEAARYYEQQVRTLGATFLDEVDRTVTDILSAPHRWPVVEADIRRCMIPRFPYAIYYRTLPDELRILPFKHHSRHPKYWRKRR